MFSKTFLECPMNITMPTAFSQDRDNQTQWVISSTTLTQNVMQALVLKWALTQHLKSQQDVCVNSKLSVKFCANTKCYRTYQC